MRYSPERRAYFDTSAFCWAARSASCSRGAGRRGCSRTSAGSGRRSCERRACRRRPWVPCLGAGGVTAHRWAAFGVWRILVGLLVPYAASYARAPLRRSLRRAFRLLSRPRQPFVTNATTAPRRSQHPRPRRLARLDRRPPEGPPPRTSRPDIIRKGPRRDLSTCSRRTCFASAVRPLRHRIR